MKKIILILGVLVAFSASATDRLNFKSNADRQTNVPKMFVIETTYIVDPAKVDPFRESHKKWVEKYTAEGTFLYAGPKGDKNGGVIIAEAIDKTQISKIIEEDSFVREKVVGIKVVEFDALFASRK